MVLQRLDTLFASQKSDLGSTWETRLCQIKTIGISPAPTMLRWNSRGGSAYLLNGAAGSDRGDIVREIIEIVNEVARGLPPGGQDPFADELPGG